MAEKGKTTILPQIVALPRSGRGREPAVTGSDNQSVREFLERFDGVLTDELVLIEKRRDGFEFVFDLTPLSWVDDAYKVGRPASRLRLRRMVSGSMPSLGRRQRGWTICFR